MNFVGLPQLLPITLKRRRALRVLIKVNNNIRNIFVIVLKWTLQAQFEAEQIIEILTHPFRLCV